MLTMRDLERHLDQKPPIVTDLADVGILDWATAQKVGRAIAWPDAALEALDQWKPLATQHPPALVVKVKGRQACTDPDRDHIGWTPGLDPMDPQQTIGIDRWWRVKNATDLIGQAFLPATRGWVLYPYTIVDAHSNGSHWQFDLDKPTDEIYAAFHQRRIKTVQGPVTQRLTDTRAQA